jgi:hypothetical protein
MEEHNFSPSLLQQILTDIATFDLHRSRIPTSLFRSIVQDMDVLLSQYGLPVEHETEEATFRFLAQVRQVEFNPPTAKKLRPLFQIFNHLVAQFGFAFKNVPEPILDGPVIPKTRLNITSRRLVLLRFFLSKSSSKSVVERNEWMRLLK